MIVNSMLEKRILKALKDAKDWLDCAINPDGSTDPETDELIKEIEEIIEILEREE